MRVTEIPFAALRFQYQLVRFPLELIEQRLLSRMDSEAPARLFCERSLGALDATVGNALGDEKLRERGAALIERSDALGRAAQLDAMATQTRDRADADLQATRDEAIQDQQEARAIGRGRAQRRRGAEAGHRADGREAYRGGQETRRRRRQSTQGVG